MKKYEIWLGNYHLGYGYDPPSKPEKVAEIEATSFKVACLLYEHKNAIKSIERQMKMINAVTDDIHFGRWYYRPETNSNDWTGRYYQSESEALESFN